MDFYYISLKSFFPRAPSYPVLDCFAWSQHCTFLGSMTSAAWEGSRLHVGSWARDLHEPESPGSWLCFSVVKFMLFSLPTCGFPQHLKALLLKLVCRFKNYWDGRKERLMMSKQMATAVKKCHISLGSHAKNDQILLPWESDGCHFETKPPGILLHYEACWRVSYLFNASQPEEAPQTLPLWETTEEKLEFHSILPYKKSKPNVFIESGFIDVLEGFIKNTKLSTDFKEVTQSPRYPLNPGKATSYKTMYLQWYEEETIQK